jgi:hypothetical protein
MFTMKTLEYYWTDGTHTIFDDYTIDKLGNVRNAMGHVLTRHEDTKGYNRVSVRHKQQRHTIRVARALASTFLGRPPTNHHTSEHEDRNRGNDVLSNIVWKNKSGQRRNQSRPMKQSNAFIIVKDGTEYTANDWIEVFKKRNGEKYNTITIADFARHQKHGFRYKTYPNLRAEVWKVIPGSKNNKGEWFISSMNRIKYKTKYAENVLTVKQLTKNAGYPVVKINGKQCSCHELSFLTFRPREYAAKLPGDIIMHENDNKLDFNPFRLRWGTPSENGFDAHKNGKHVGTKKARKPVASYFNGEFEKEYESFNDAVRYLRENGYSAASDGNIHHALNNDVVRYDRVWKSLYNT